MRRSVSRSSRLQEARPRPRRRTESARRAPSTARSDRCRGSADRAGRSASRQRTAPPRFRPPSSRCSGGRCRPRWSTRTESMRRRVAMFISAGMRAFDGQGTCCTDNEGTSGNGNYNDADARAAVRRTCSRSSSGSAAWSCSARSSRPTTFQVLQAQRAGGGPRAGRRRCSARSSRRFHYVAYAAGGVLLVTLAAMARARPAAGALRRSQRDHRARCWASRSTPASSCSAASTRIQREVGTPARHGCPAGDARRIRVRRAAPAVDAADDVQHGGGAGAAVLGSVRNIRHAGELRRRDQQLPHAARL